MAKWTPAQQAAIQDAAQAELSRQFLLDFCKRMAPNYEESAHITLLIERLEALERREIRKLIVEMPPRHSKSYHVSERFPAWYLGRHPDHPVVIASYGAALAERQSGRIRNLVTNPRYPFETALSPTTGALTRWETTDGAEVVAAGVGGALTGMGATLGIIDDPIKGREEANSENHRQKIWEWYTDVFKTRLMPDAIELVTMTRWHEADLVGRILDSSEADEWNVLRLPALAEDDDPLGRKRDEALWSERYDTETLLGLKELLGSRSFISLYQQRPTAEEGGIFKADWMQHRYDVTPPEVASREGRKLDTPWHVAIAVDSSWDAGVEHDYSVISVWATDLRNYYLIDVHRERMIYPDLRSKVIEVFGRQATRPFSVFVESAANGRALIQDLQRNTPIPVVGVYPRGSKESRAAAVTPLFESGRVLLPESAPWLDDWIDEHLAFPNGTYDDQVDPTSLVLSQLSKRFKMQQFQMETDDYGVGLPDRHMSPRLRGELTKRIADQSSGRVVRVR